MNMIALSHKHIEDITNIRSVDCYRIVCRIWAGVRDYVCETCGKDVKISEHLRHHVLTKHLGHYRYHCDKCGHGINKKSKLKVRYTTELFIHSAFTKPFLRFHEIGCLSCFSCYLCCMLYIIAKVEVDLLFQTHKCDRVRRKTNTGELTCCFRHTSAIVCDARQTPLTTRMSLYKSS